MTTQNYLNNYFQNEWKSSIPGYKYSGDALIRKVKPNESVVDVGCGDNYFKRKISNLVGIDPANDRADFKVTIEEFETDQKFDVAFCLGSINFGDEKRILTQIEKVISLLKPNARIYWRCNPGKQDHPTVGCKEIEFFPWTFEFHQWHAPRLGFTIKELCWDTQNRIYAEWVRS